MGVEDLKVAGSFVGAEDLKGMELLPIAFEYFGSTIWEHLAASYEDFVEGLIKGLRVVVVLEVFDG